MVAFSNKMSFLFSFFIIKTGGEIEKLKNETEALKNETGKWKDEMLEALQRIEKKMDAVLSAVAPGPPTHEH